MVGGYCCLQGQLCDLLLWFRPNGKWWGCMRIIRTLPSGGSRISRRGGVDLVGGLDSRGRYVSKILYVKMKELGPLEGGGHTGCAP